ncbi:hypothetical protein B0H17DRAFT_1138840 [Mycena rosella]|uniref:Uncharacterized protein n=1 Tax=Mycena rosella TaxID=1033263 RepID=A0AAD7D5Y4_MYCRO|nr:hypothetical protein B0H17DRAFT_1138840 [Mycena rosella]
MTSASPRNALDTSGYQKFVVLCFMRYLLTSISSSKTDTGHTLGSAFKQKSKSMSKINDAEAADAETKRPKPSKAKTSSTSRKPAKGWVYLGDDDKGAPDVDVPAADKHKRQASKKGASQPSKRKHPQKKKATKSSTVIKTKHAAMDSEDELERVPAPSTPKKLASAVKGKGKAVKSAKKVKIEEEEKVLETTSVLKVKSLPAECEVTNVDLQDPALAEAGVYDSLPPLHKVVATPWTSAQGPGNILLSTWDQYNKVLNVDSAWSFINLSRRYVLSTKGATAVCLSLMMAVKSSVSTPSTVIDSQKGLKLKFLTAIAHSQEFEQMIAVLGMISPDAIIFGTKTMPANVGSSKAVESKLTNGVKSTSIRVGGSRNTPSADVLSYEDEIPVLDGRYKVVDFDTDVDNIGKYLPRYDSVEDEIQNGACVGIGYTVSKFTTKDGKESIGFNIKWVIVFGEPGDD